MGKNKSHKIMNKTIFSIIRLCFLMSFLVYVVVMGATSFGWFAKNDRVNGGGLDISTQTPDVLISDISYFAVTQITETGDSRQFTLEDANERVKGNSDFVMPSYDEAGIEYSQYLPVMVVKISYQVKEDSTYGLYFCSPNNIGDVYSHESYTSNVLSISVATPNAEESFATVSNSVTKHSFTQVSENEVTQTVFTSGDEDFEIKISDINNGSSSGVIWFIIEYNEDVVRNISQYHQDHPHEEVEAGGEVENLNEVITYASDIYFVIK